MDTEEALCDCSRGLSTAALTGHRRGVRGGIMTTAGGEAAVVDRVAVVASTRGRCGSRRAPDRPSRRWSALDVAIVVALAVSPCWPDDTCCRTTACPVMTPGSSSVRRGARSRTSSPWGLESRLHRRAHGVAWLRHLGRSETWSRIRRRDPRCTGDLSWRSRSFGTARPLCLFCWVRQLRRRGSMLRAGTCQDVCDRRKLRSVLGLTVVVPLLVRRTWGWRLGAMPGVSGRHLGFFTRSAMIAVVVAGVIVLLRPTRLPDRAVAIGLGTAVLVLSRLRCGKLRPPPARELVVVQVRRLPERSRRSVQVVGSVFTHAHRVASVFAGGPTWWAMACLVLVALALMIDAFARGTHPAAGTGAVSVAVVRGRGGRRSRTDRAIRSRL